MKKSTWLEGASRHLWHPCTQMKQLESAPPLAIERGEGPWLIDFEGRRYLDAISSWWVNLFGHCNPRINAAIRDQLEKIEHVLLAGCVHEPVAELSSRLAVLTGLDHAFYGSDGASSVEIALKMSFHYWRNTGHPEKAGFVSLQNGYHGETLGALSVTDVALFRDTYAPLLRRTHQTMTPDWRLAKPGESADAYAHRCAQVLDSWLADHHTETAALIVEPLVQGAAGMAMHHPAYLRRAREICDRHQVHLIADEIAVGFGRTGTMFACEQAQMTPDFICLSKGISGGYLPLSVVLTRDAVYDAFYADETARGFLHSHSYTGNPLACRAALAVLDIFEEDRVLASNRNRSGLFTALLAEVGAHPRVAHFRNTGMIWAFDVEDAAPDFPREFHRRALEKGVLLRPIGNTVYFMPPYVIEEPEMRRLAEVVLETLDAIPATGDLRRPSPTP
jgi:adenosylmethionine---8-amino-7-oxononanoate aminotransferase